MRTAIVTGASKGIGRTVALKLAAMGYNLAVTGRTETLLNELKMEIETGGGHCLPLVVDMQDTGPTDL